jgi:hypothetical protein
MGLWDAVRPHSDEQRDRGHPQPFLGKGFRQGDPLGPLMFSLGIRQLLDDLASALGPERLILAYHDDIYILSNDPNALEDVQAYFLARQPSIQLNC